MVFLAFGVFAQEGTLTVNDVDSEAGTGLTEIEYEFTGDAGNYDIRVEVDFADGEGFRIIEIDDISGDWKNVTPGGPYSITWDGMASYPETYSEETVIRLTAEFVYFLSLQSEPSEGGTATDETDTGPYKEDAVIDIKAEPNTRYSFVNWTAAEGTFEDAGEMETAFTMPAENVTVTANFELIYYDVNLTANPEEGGEVTGEGVFNFEEEVTITATPEEGWEFVNWTDDDDGDAVVSTDASYTFDMPASNVNYTANFLEYPINGDGVSDIDGNEYATVIIGNQEWMAENLRVTRYNNGDDIPTDLSDDDWEDTTEGASAIYPHTGGSTENDVEGIESDEEMLEAYGKLYNWYAVDDPRGLCPEGWRVPSDDDWTQLVDFVVDQGFPNEIGNPNGAGNALKSCRQVGHDDDDCNTSDHPRWKDGTHSGFDEYGFSALPGGNRWLSGIFSEVGFFGNWWSATELSGSNARVVREMSSYDGSVNLSSDFKTIGFSVRCLRGGPTTYDLHLEVQPENAGSVSGAGEYQEGDEVSITAIPNGGWEFVNWTGDVEVLADENAAATTLTMPTGDVELTAHFQQKDGSDIIYGDGVTDIDGNEYVTVIIGNQEWMAENLRVTRDADGNNISRRCYDNSPTNCELYGGLYTWNTVMNDEHFSWSNPSGVQGICPDGWHVPSILEWLQLGDYLVNQGYQNSLTDPNGAGNALKSCRQVNSPLGGDCDTSDHPRWDEDDEHSGFDAFGFSALPGGKGPFFIFDEIGKGGYWWTTSDSDTPLKSVYLTINYSSGRLHSDITETRNSLSVRCVRSPDQISYSNL